MTQDPGDQFGIVPELFVERPRESLNGDLITLPVFKLKIIPGIDTIGTTLYDPSFLYPRGDPEVIGNTGEDLIWPAIQQTYYTDPFLLIVLEPDYLGIQLLRTMWCPGLLEFV